MGGFEGLIDRKPPPPNRKGWCEGGEEDHLTEGAVTVAFAMHLLRTIPGLKHVDIHPDGEHAKRFDFRGWLENQGFSQTKPGNTSYGGLYSSSSWGTTILVNPKPEVGDVVADIDGRSYVAECKGGVVNSRHAGQKSRLRKGLCEAVGQCLQSDSVEGRRQFAVVPFTSVTEALAHRMIKRTKAAGVEIALVDREGNVIDVH
jgi:hypothetical protein